MFEITLTPSQNAYISEWYPNYNFSSSTALFIGRYLQAGDSYRSLIKFELNKIPPNSTIKNAVLELSINRNEAVHASNIAIYPILTTWQENSVTWYNSPDARKTAINNSVIKKAFKNKIHINLTELIKSWYEGLIPNHGVLLMGEEQANNLIAFHSTNFPSKVQHPTLHISYEKAKQHLVSKEELYIPKYPPYAPLDISTPIHLGREKNATFLIKNNSNSYHVQAITQVGYSDDQNETFFNTGKWQDLNAEGYPGEAIALTVTDIAEFARVLVKGKGGEIISVWHYTAKR